MAERRLHMRKTRQVLRLAMKERLPQRVGLEGINVSLKLLHNGLQ